MSVSWAFIFSFELWLSVLCWAQVRTSFQGGSPSGISAHILLFSLTLSCFWVGGEFSIYLLEIEQKNSFIFSISLQQLASGRRRLIKFVFLWPCWLLIGEENRRVLEWWICREAKPSRAGRVREWNQISLCGKNLHYIIMWRTEATKDLYKVKWGKRCL